MYVTNNPITLKWELAPTANSLINETFFVKVDRGDLNDNLFSKTSITYPTATTKGEITYTYTPTSEGFYRFHLASGTPGAYTVLGRIQLQVFDQVTERAEIFTRVFV